VRRHLSLLLLVVALLGSAAPASAAGDPARSRQWDLEVIGADAAHRVADGAGVVVAVVDSGVDLRHEDLAGHLVPGHDFVDDDDVPQDEFGHGTHVAGLVAAAAGNGKGIEGVAPGAKVMPIRVLGADGSGNLDDVVAGIRWAVAHGATVINLSLGEDTQTLLGPAFGDALREAWAAGAVPVVSAGNQFLTGSGFRNEPALVVAATDRKDAKPTYSSGVGAAQWGIAAPGGELPDLGADGAILSTYWTGKAPNQYAYLAGTSQAAPHVAGAVAVLLSTGQFTPSQAVHRLLDTAEDIGVPGHDRTFGAGRLDLAAAVAGLPAEAHGRPGTAAKPPVSTPRRSTTTTTAMALPAPVLTAPAPTALAQPVPTSHPTTRVPSSAVVASGRPARSSREQLATDRTWAVVAAVVLLGGVGAAAAVVGRRRRPT
jgi:subtilisin family serine protease